MTEQIPGLRATVTSDGDEKLAALHTLYADTKEKADAAAAEHKAVADALKLELTQRAPEGSRRIRLDGSYGPSLALAYSESWRVDSKRLKTEDPETYARFAKKSGSWSLRAAPAGGEDE